MQTTGALWKTLCEMNSHGFFMGSGTHPGSDRNRNNSGIVYGHAYSILDLIELDG